MRPVLNDDERRLMPCTIVALAQQQLGQVGAVLAGDAGDQCDLAAHDVLLSRMGGGCAAALRSSIELPRRDKVPPG